MGNIKIIIGIVTFIVIAGLGAGLYVLYGQLHDKNIEIATKTAQVEAKTAEVTRITEENVAWQTQLAKLTEIYSQSQKDISSLNYKLGQAQIQRDTTKKEYEEYKARRNVVLAKPKIIEALANKATKKVHDDMSCATGNLPACGVAK